MYKPPKTTFWHNGATMFGRRLGSSAQIVLLSTFLRIFAFSSYTRNVCTDCLRQKNTFGHWTATLTCFGTLYPCIQRGHWRFFRNMEENNGHLNNPRRRRIKKHRGKHAGICKRLRDRAHIPWTHGRSHGRS